MASPYKSGSSSGKPLSSSPSTLGKPPSPSSIAKRKVSQDLSPSKRHKVSPSTARRKDFEICNPFVRISTRVSDIGDQTLVDKFSGHKVDVDALKAFFAWGPGRAIRRTLEAFHNTAGEELKYRGALCQLFPSFHMLAKQRMQVVDVKAEIVTSDVSEVSDARDADSSQSPIIHHAIHEYGDVLEGNQAVDFVVQTLPKKKVTEIIEDAMFWGDDIQRALHAAHQDSKMWKCVAVVEAKDSTLPKFWLQKYAYQVGIYGTQVVKDNLEKGFVRPIYLLCMSDEDWRLATIDPYGVIEVENNAISLVSFQKFERMQNARFKWFEHKKAPPEVKMQPLSHEQLNMILAKRNEEYKVTDGSYVVGMFYIDEEGYSWDGSLSRLNSENPISMGTLRLMEGLLRVFIGDKVLSWKKEDILAALLEMESQEINWCKRREM